MTENHPQTPRAAAAMFLANTAVELSKDRPEPIHGDDLPVPDEYDGLLPMPGDRW